MCLGVHFGSRLRGLGRRPLIGRPGTAGCLHTADDGSHRSIDSALLFALSFVPAFDGSHPDGEHGGYRNDRTSGEGGNYLSGIGHH